MNSIAHYKVLTQRVAVLLIGVLVTLCAQAQSAPDSLAITTEPDSIGMDYDEGLPQYIVADTLQAFSEDSIAALYAREHLLSQEVDDTLYEDRYFERFNPVPAKAVWMSALFPGAGQIYNRKYWKLPIVYGGFLGLIYGYNWNNRYYKTYQNAYRDLVTGSPSASYKQFLSRWSDQDIQNQRSYLERTFQRRKNLYRNWRDYCVVGMLGVYLVAMVDAYVDAALYHFDVSPELDAYNSPSVMVSYKLDF